MKNRKITRTFTKTITVLALAVVLCISLLSISCKKSKEGEKVVLPENLAIQANNVFFYYKDLDKAVKFYEEILGLERVLDYGFAKIFRISETSYVGLVDEKEGMHKTMELKTVTLSFITNEVDSWYDYLVSKGVEMRGSVRSSTRHATRGFVAYDPEGYFLEFETFLDDPENEKLLHILSTISPVFPSENLKTSRPGDLGFHANVIWLYYKDLEEAQKFYEETFGFTLLVDQGFAKVYTSSPSCFIGLVDGAEGLHEFSEEKSVNVCFFSEQIDEWYDYLVKKGLEMRGPLDNAESGRVRAFVTYDIAGYYLEFDKFNEHEDNRIILELLKK